MQLKQDHHLQEDVEAYRNISCDPLLENAKMFNLVGMYIVFIKCRQCYFYPSFLTSIRDDLKPLTIIEILSQQFRGGGEWASSQFLNSTVIWVQ